MTYFVLSGTWNLKLGKNQFINLVSLSQLYRHFVAHRCVHSTVVEGEYCPMASVLDNILLWFCVVRKYELQVFRGTNGRYDNFLEAIHRRNDTFYVVSFRHVSISDISANRNIRNRTAG